MEPQSRPYDRIEQVETAPLNLLLAEVQPTILVCDIEGGELGLFDDADLTGVRAVIIELHPKVYGADGTVAVETVLAGKGLFKVPGFEQSAVQYFLRDASDIGRTTPEPRRFRRQLPARSEVAPSVMVTSCMKDEAPFLLEWVAWNRAIGVKDILVFSNDCSDGTDLMLDQLDRMGILRHLPNPAALSGSTSFQPIALRYTQQMRAFSGATHIFSTDVDEFLNIRVGEGRLADLFAATGTFDALSATEINHGSNGQLVFEPGWVKDLFPLHQSEMPHRRQAHRGVKTIVRRSEKLATLRNHRSDFRGTAEDIVWLDGSGRRARVLASDRNLNGHDSRGTYNLVSLDHFPLRSLESFLVKIDRGDTINRNRVALGKKYWRTRDDNESLTSRFDLVTPVARAIEADLRKNRPIEALHKAACEAHSARIQQLKRTPLYSEALSWLKQAEKVA